MKKWEPNMNDLKDLNNSYVCYDEFNTKLMNIVDKKFRNIALALNAAEYHIPALISHDVLEKCGYFSSFPQHLTIAGHADPEKYAQITRDRKITTEDAVISNQYFTPAACLHIYPMLENEKIDTKIVTTKARVYRYEDSDYNGTTRLWDFTVREIVFIGSKDFVNENLQNMKAAAEKFVTDIGLSAKIVSAKDNFYPSKRNAVKQKIQISNSLKYEMVTQIHKENVAIASFNYHDTHFSKPFKFEDSGKIVTGCVGFGLERWVTVLNYYNIVLQE